MSWCNLGQTANGSLNLSFGSVEACLAASFLEQEMQEAQVNGASAV